MSFVNDKTEKMDETSKFPNRIRLQSVQQTAVYLLHFLLFLSAYLITELLHFNAIKYSLGLAFRKLDIFDMCFGCA